jgi:hypothetical protein
MLAAMTRKQSEARSPEEEGRPTALPYPGLSYFTARTREVFVGREKQAERVLERLGESQTVLIVGGSGCGKSSLIRGGVLPMLTSSTPVPDRNGAWYAVIWRPERAPIDRLKAVFCADFLVPMLEKLKRKHERLTALRAEQQTPTADLEQRITLLEKATPEAYLGLLASTASVTAEDCAEQVTDQIFADDPGPSDPAFCALAEEVETLDRVLAEDPRTPPANLLLVVDQFEEVFRSEVRESQRRRLMALIRYVFAYKPHGVFLALVMRSEDLHRCAEEPGLADIVNTSSMFVDWLDRPQLRRAIIEPAQLVFRTWLRPIAAVDEPSYPYSPGLVDALLDEADKLKDSLEHKGDHLPLLQHGLQVLWSAASQVWSKIVADAETADRDIDPQQLIIDLPLLEEEASKARSQVREFVGAGAEEKTRLQWLLAGEAESAFRRAQDIYQAKRPRGQAVSPGLALQAAFCEMASLDENRRYYRAFREAAEIVARRFESTNPETIIALDAALAEFETRGLLSSTVSGARDVTHEALIRNWPRLASWVAEDNKVEQAMSDAIIARRIDSWDQARALEPVLGWPHLPIYSFAWARDVAGKSGRKQFTLRAMRQLRLWYGWVRWRSAFAWTGGLTVVILGAALLIYAFRQGAEAAKQRLESEVNHMRGDLMVAYAIAANQLSSQSNTQPMSLRAKELLHAARVWQEATNGLQRMPNLPADAPVRSELRLTERWIDLAVRDLLGRRFTVRKRGPNSPILHATCKDLPSQPDIASHQDGGAPEVMRLGNSQRAVKLDVPSSTKLTVPLHLETVPRNSATADFVPVSVSSPLPDIAPASQVCLSDDASILTISQEGILPWPRIFLLGWHGTDPNEPNSRAAPSEIGAPGFAPEINEALFNNRPVDLKPSVTGISPADPVTGERVVEFDLRSSPVHYLASFHEGYVAPSLGSAPADTMYPCSPISSESVIATASAGTRESVGKSEACAVSLSTLKLRSDAQTIPGNSYGSPVGNSPQGLDICYVRADFFDAAHPQAAADEKLPRLLVGFYASPIDSARIMTIGKHKEFQALYLHDKAGETWILRLITDLASIQPRLEEIAAMSEQGGKWSDVCATHGCDASYHPLTPQDSPSQ